jgi:L-ascorbate metabolism protein UlaG (beta-lactamase superfamily)
MAELAPVDVALLPVAGWGPSLGPGHMDAEQAARAAALVRPAIAIPIHWGTFAPIGLRRGRDRLLGDPPQAFAEHAAKLAPGTRVEILQPGESIALT